MPNLTAVDFHILATLHAEPFAAQESIRRTAGVSAAAVSVRLKQLEDTGVLRGLWIAPHGACIGRQDVHTSHRALEGVTASDVLGVDDVVLVNERHDGSFSVFSARPAGEIGPSAALLNLLGKPVFASPTEPARVSPVLSRMDWRMLLTMIDSPRARATEIAASSGLAAKTVRARRSALWESGLLRAGPLLELEGAEGRVLYEIAVELQRPLAVDAMKGLLPGSVVIGRSGDARAVYLFAHAGSPSEAFRAAQGLEQQDAVARAHPIFPRRRVWAKDRVRDWMEKAAGRWT